MRFVFRFIFSSMLFSGVIIAAPEPRDLSGTFDFGGGKIADIHARLFLPEGPGKVCGFYFFESAPTPILLLGDRGQNDPRSLVFLEYVGGARPTGSLELREEGGVGIWYSPDRSKVSQVRLAGGKSVFPSLRLESNFAGVWTGLGPFSIELEQRQDDISGFLHIPGRLIDEPQPGRLELRGGVRGNVATLAWNNAQGSAGEALLVLGGSCAVWCVTLDTGADEAPWPAGELLVRDGR